MNVTSSNLDLKLMRFFSINNLDITSYSVYSTIYRFPGINGVNIHKSLANYEISLPLSSVYRKINQGLDQKLIYQGEYIQSNNFNDKFLKRSSVEISTGGLYLTSECSSIIEEFNSLFNYAQLPLFP